MAFKRPLPVSPPPSPSRNNDTTKRQSKNSSESRFCLICGDKARFINYGALSCQSCKTFFRRNGFRPEDVRLCGSNKCCKVNMLTRSNCTACRFAKCLSMGMNTQLIRKEDCKNTKSNTTQLVVSTELAVVPQLPTLDLLRGDRSCLIDSEWTLLSNIVHSHDTYSTVSQVHRTIEILSKLPVELHFNVINPLEMIAQLYRSMQSFINSSPHFRVLTVAEQSSLFERNLHGIIAFCSTLFFRDTGILQNSECMKAFTTVYGSEAMFQMKFINNRLDPDSTLIKLSIIVFAFSSNCFIVNIHENMQYDDLLFSAFRLFGSQNVYVELLWKYMVYRYGYEESALRFARLVEIFLFVLRQLEIVYKNNKVHQKMVDDVVKDIKKSLTISETQQAPLWGKTQSPIYETVSSHSFICTD